MATRTDPSTTSSDYDAMLPFWDKVEAILEGREAVIAGGEEYLPRFENETDDRYNYRLANAKFTNIYSDVVANLAAKPFVEPVTLADGADSRFDVLSEDIDGRGNNLHVFAAEVFFGGVNYAVDWIFVDFTKATPRADGKPLSLAEEGPRGQNLRPYWVRVPAKRLLAVYADTVKGREVIVHARMREDVTLRNGFDETGVERVRVLNREPIFAMLGDGTVTDRIIDYAPATYEVWEKVSRSTGAVTSSQWEVVESGAVRIGVIPLVPFITGRRKGGSWQFVPPMKAAADTQIEHYQAETGLKLIKILTAYPMLAGNGVQPEVTGGVIAKAPVGPYSVLYAPPIMGDSSATHGEWKWIEPTAENVKFLAEQVDAIEAQIRELGRQPLVAAQMTVIQAGMNAQKANSAIQAWALALKDALEQAFVYTAMWLGLGEQRGAEVNVFTDFSLESGDEKGPDWLRDMAKRGRLSRETEWEEAQRRGVLSGDFDPDQEDERIAAEAPDPDGEADLTGAITPPANDRNAA